MAVNVQFLFIIVQIAIQRLQTFFRERMAYFGKLGILFNSFLTNANSNANADANPNAEKKEKKNIFEVRALKKFF